jgi:predicted naringenin-chalcone synthase
METSNLSDKIHHIASKSYLFPNTKSMITWDLGSAGFNMGLSPALPKYIEKELKATVETILAEEGLEISDIGNWAVHPGGPKILEACQAALSISDEQVGISWKIYRDFGNMSSATVGFILERMLKEERQGYCVAIAFAPGVRMEIAILHF